MKASLNLPSENQIFMNKFIIRLRYYREAQNLGQAEMANLLQIGMRSYQRYESGESTPPLHMLYSLAKILQVQPEDLITEKMRGNRDLIALFEGDKKKIFEEDTLVKESNLLKIFNSEEYRKALECSDLTLMRNNPLFESANHSLFMASPKYCLVNPFAKDRLGYKKDYVPISKAYESLKLQGDQWAYLFGKRKCYVQSIFYSKKALENSKLTCKYIFVSHKNNYYSLGAVERN